MKHFRPFLFCMIVAPLFGQGTQIDWQQIRQSTIPPIGYTNVVNTWTAQQNFNAGATFGAPISGTTGTFSALTLSGALNAANGFFTAATSTAGNDTAQNIAIPNGGYQALEPVTYNPYNGVNCMDNWGNLVQQPIPATGASAFGPNTLVIWNSLSPSMPFTNTDLGLVTGLVQNVVFTSPPSTGPGPCGVPLPINGDYGVNTNGYYFARAGLATDSPFYNSIQSLQGGMVANSYTAAVLYPTGTVTTTGTLTTPTYLGGHVDVGHSVGPPAAGTIATVTNPFSAGEGLVAGMIYYDDQLQCLRVYSGTAWSCTGGGGGGGVPALPVNSVQFNAGGSPNVFGGSSNFTFNSSTNILTAIGGFVGTIFDCTATSTASCITQQSGTFSITGAGNANFQNVNSNSVTPALVNAGATGTVNTSATGNTVTWVSGDQFQTFWPPAGSNPGTINIAGSSYTIATVPSSTSLTLTTSPGNHTGETYYYTGIISQSVNGTYYSTGDGGINGQYEALQLGITVGAGAYGINSSGVATVSACNGCTAATYCLASGTNTLTCPGVPAPVSYTTGMLVSLQVVNTNTTSVTLAINSLAAITLHQGGSNLSASTLIAGNTYTIQYDGTYFNLLATGQPGSPTTSVQFNSGGVFAGSANMEWNNSTGLLSVCPTITGSCVNGSAGIYSQTFNSPVTGTNTAITVNSGAFLVQGSGAVFASTLTAGTGSPFSVNAAGNIGTSGTLTVGGTASITGNLTVNSSYGLTSAGALTVASCTGCGSGGGPAGSVTQIQYNNTGVFGASANLTYSTSTGILTVGASGSTPGVVAPLFNCTATGGSACAQQSSGNWSITGAGTAAFVALNVGTGSPFTVGSGGNLSTTGTVSFPGASAGAELAASNSSTGIAISATSTGSGGTALYATSSSGLSAHFATGTVQVDNAMTVGGNLTVNSSYGLTSAGALTVASCTGCGSSAAGSATQIQYNTGSGFGASANLTYSTTTGEVTIGSSGTTPGFVGPALYCTATSTAECVEQQSGTFYVLGNGYAGFNALNVGTGCSGQGSSTGCVAWITSAGAINGYTLAAGTNNGTVATGGGGATVNNSGSTTGIYEYDTGGVCAIGTGRAGGIACTSDERMKNNIQPLPSALSSVLSLHPVTFDWNAGGHSVGFTAQDVQQVFPLLVSKNPDGDRLMLSEQGLLPYAIRAIQEQQIEIEELRKEINESHATLNARTATARR